MMLGRAVRWGRSWTLPRSGGAEPRTVYLDHAATTPMVPAAVEAMTAHLLEVGNPSSLHASGRHARRVVEESRETIAQALGLPPRRGGVHLRRHRGRQPRGQGHPLGPAGRGPAPHPGPGQRGRAPRRPRRAGLAARGGGRRGRAAAGRRPRPARRRGAARGGRARPGVRLADLGDVGQQRGRHPAAGRGGGRDRGRARHPGAHRRRPGRRRGAGRLRHQSASTRSPSPRTSSAGRTASAR